MCMFISDTNYMCWSVLAIVFTAVKQVSSSEGRVDILAGCHLLFLLLANKRSCLCAKHSKRKCKCSGSILRLACTKLMRPDLCVHRQRAKRCFFAFFLHCETIHWVKLKLVALLSFHECPVSSLCLSGKAKLFILDKKKKGKGGKLWEGHRCRQPYINNTPLSINTCI